MDQFELEKRVRYYIGHGVVFTDDFIKKNIGVDKMKTINMDGSYIIKIQKPTPCIFITFGAGGSFVIDSPVCKIMSVSRSQAEVFKMGSFVGRIDPENKYGIHINVFHIDMKESHAAFVKRPTDIEIAQLQLNHRDFKYRNIKGRGCVKRGIKRKDDRLTRELRALDRRRYHEAGILPPPERRDSIEIIKDGRPRTGGWIIKKNKIDVYRSDSDEEVEKDIILNVSDYRVGGIGEDEEENEEEECEIVRDEDDEDEKEEIEEDEDYGGIIDKCMED
jgi:hypothetical protein